MPSRQEKLFLSTDMVEEKLRYDYWRQVSSVIYDTTAWNINGDQGLRGTASSRLFGSMVVGATTFNDQKCSRDLKIIARTSLELYIVQLVLSGEGQGDYNGADVNLRQGDILIHDLTQKMAGQVSAGARLSIAVARSEIQRRVKRQNLHGLVLRAESPITHLLSEYMIGLDKVLTDLELDASADAQEALLILLASAINGEGGDIREIPINLPMKQRIIDFIDRNIVDPLLNPQLIMNSFRVSRSHLYRIFDTEGGVARFIRDRRLDLAYRLLSSQNSNGLSNKEIIHRSGLSDTIHFAKIFKERFGILPTETRDAFLIGNPGREEVFRLHRHMHEQIFSVARR